MKKFALVLTAGLFLAGCSTVATPFTSMAPDYKSLPAEAMTALAQEIEAEVRAGNRDATVENQGGLVVDTPEIRQAIRTRAARWELIDAFLDAGYGSEKQNGLIAVVHSDEYKKSGTRKSRDRDAVLIMGENIDRWTLYEGILKASELSPRALSAIQAIFAKARINLLDSGQFYEDESGTRVVKE